MFTDTKKNWRGVVIVFLAGILLLPGCTAVPKLVATPTHMSPTASSAPTDTMEPTSTATLPPTSTAMPTDTPAPTATPVPPNELADAKFLTSGQLSGWRYFIAVEAPKPIIGQYTMNVEDSKLYSCEVIPQFPKRLYCTGQLQVLDDYINYVILEKASGRKVFEGRLFIPVQKN
jgi:hypothetical protein